MTDGRDKLILIARLRAELVAWHREGRITSEEFRTSSAEIDRLNLQVVQSSLPARSLQELLSGLDESDLRLDRTVFQAQLREHLVGRIRELRSRATKAESLFLDLEEVYPGVSRVPLSEWSWQETGIAYRELVAFLEDPETSFEEARNRCEGFFASRGDFVLPAELPKLSRTLVNRLLRSLLVSSRQASVLADDVHKLDASSRQRWQRLSSRALATGEIQRSLFDPPSDIALQLLRNVVRSMEPVAGLDVDALVVQWSGPCFPHLASAWFRPLEADSIAGRTRKANLILARSGIDPLTSPSDWNAALTHQSVRERRERAVLVEEINRNKLLYELAIVLSARSELGDALEARWWPAVVKLRRPADAPTKVPVVLQRESRPRPRNETVVEEVHEYVVPEDEAELLEAAPAQSSAEDRLVEIKSTWSVYLKPFLSENWLGLMGVFSLMIAWMFLTLWLWDAGAFVRILTGAVPLLALTLGSAFITRFMHRLEGASEKAVSLFGSLCFLSIPFNFTLGASVLAQGVENLERQGSGGGVAVGIGAGLAVLYATLLPLVSRWITHAFGHNPVRFLLEVNFPIYLPPLALFALGESRVTEALAATLVLTYLALIRGLLRARRSETYFRFSWLLCATVFLLANAIPHVYYRQAPSILALALLLQLVAPTLTFFGKQSPTSVATAGGISLLGLILALNEPIILPLGLSLATLFWFYERRWIKAAWTNEVLALHFLGLAASVAYLLPVSMVVLPSLLGLAVVPVVILERRSQRPTLVLSYGLPLYLLATVVCNLPMPTSPALFVNASLLALAFLYAYGRYVVTYRVGLWFLNLFLFVGLQLWGLYEVMAGGLSVPLYLGVVGFVWALVSRRLEDPLTLAHRTFVLWCLGFVSAAYHGVVLVSWLWGGGSSTPLDSFLLVGAIMTVFVLLLAARRSRSALPIYVGLLVVGLAGRALRVELGFAGRTGLLTAILAVGVLALATVLARGKVWQSGPVDTMFRRPFPGRGEAYLYRPLEVGVLFLALVSATRACFGFAPATLEPRIGLAFFLCASLLGILAYRFGSPFLGTLALAPAGGVLATLSLSLPLAWRWHSILIWVALLHLARRSIEGRSDRCRSAIGKPLGGVTTVLTYSTIPLGFLLYPWLAYGVMANWWSLVPLLAFSGLLIAFSHLYLSPGGEGYAQVVLLHVIAAWTAYYFLVYRPFLVADPLPHLLPYAGGIALLLLTVAYALEWSKGSVWRGYSRGAQPWITLFSVVFAVVSLWPVRSIEPAVPFTYYPVLAWILLHLGNRRWHSFGIVLLKGLVLIRLGLFLFADPLAAVFLGTLVFYLLERILARVDSRVPLRLQAGPFAKGEGPRPRIIAIATSVLIAGLLLVHILLLGGFLNLYGGVNHFWLYGLIPLCLVLRKSVAYSYLTHLGFGLFAYANSFYALELLPLVEAYDLTQLHLLGVAFIVSIGGYVLAGPYVRAGSES